MKQDRTAPAVNPELPREAASTSPAPVSLPSSLAQNLPAGLRGPSQESTGQSGPLAQGSNILLNPSGPESRLLGLVAGESTEHSNVYANADRSNTLVTSPEPINYQNPAGQWVPIDNTVVADASVPKGLRTAANSWTAHFEPLPAGLMVDTAGGGQVRFSPVGVSVVTPEVTPDGRGVVYSDAWPGVDLVYEVNSTSLEEILVVRSVPTASSYMFLTGSTGFGPAGSGGLVSSNAVGSRPIRVGTPTVLDQKGTVLPAAPSETAGPTMVGQQSISIEVPTAFWKSLPSAAYPVSIDPTISFNSDNHASYASPTTDVGLCEGANNCGFRMGNQYGEEAPAYGNNGTNENIYWRTVATYPTENAVLAGTDITNAYFDLNTPCVQAYCPSTTQTSEELYANLLPSNTTYNNSTGWTEAGGGTQVAQGQYLLYNQTDWEAYLTGSALATQLSGLVNAGTTQMFIGFHGLESPNQLSFKAFTGFDMYVTYYQYPSTPTGLAVTPCSNYCTGSPVYANSATPTLKATATDGDGLGLTLNYVLDTSDGSQVATGSTTIASGATGSWTVPATDKLAEGRAYKYQVQACVTSVAGDCSAWSAWSPFTVDLMGAPSNVVAFPGDGQADVTWTASSYSTQTAPPLQAYIVKAFSATGTVTTTVSCAQVYTCDNAIVTGLANGTAWTFQVIPYNAAFGGQGLAANTATGASTTPSTASTAYPPQGAAATAGNGDAYVSWSPAPVDGGPPVTTYYVNAFNLNNGGSFAGQQTVPATKTSLLFTGLTNGTPYEFVVYSYNGRTYNGVTYTYTTNGGETSTVTPGTNPVPFPVTAAVATVKDGTVTVEWSPNPNGGAVPSAYVVAEYCLTGTPLAWTGINYWTLPATTFSDTLGSPLTYGEQCIYVVYAENSAGNSIVITNEAVVPHLPLNSNDSVPYLGRENYWDYTTRPLGSGATASVNAASGNLVVSQTDSTPVIGHGGLGLIVGRTYNSQDATGVEFPGSFGAGWTLNLGEADDLIGSGIGTSGIYFQGDPATNAASLGHFLPDGLTHITESLPAPLDVVLVDQDGTHHTFTPTMSVGAGNTALSATADLNPEQLLAMITAGNPALKVAPAASPDTTLCVDTTYQAPPGVELAMWRYIAITGQSTSNCTLAASDTNVFVAGYGAERPDGLRFEWSPTGELLSMTTRAGEQLSYRYDTLPALSALPVPLGRLRSVYESSVPGCTASSASPYAPPASCRSFVFTYSDTDASCALDNAPAVASTTCLTDPAGRVTRYDFDAAQGPHGYGDTPGSLLSGLPVGDIHLIRVVNPDGTTVSYSYGTSCSTDTAHASPDLMCSTTDPRGDTTRFAYGADPQNTATIDPAGGMDVLTSITDRLSTATNFTQLSPPATLVDTATNTGGSCNYNSTSACEQVEYAGIDSSGRVAEIDQGSPAPGGTQCNVPTALNNHTCASQVTQDTWDTAGATCAVPAKVDNNLCDEKRLALNDTETTEANGIATADKDTKTKYTITGAPLIIDSVLKANDTAAATDIYTTYGYSLQFWPPNGAATTGSYTVAGNGTSTANFTSAPSGTLFTLIDKTQSLSPNGNAAGSGWQPYLTTYVDDTSTTTDPNVLQTSNGSPAAASVCGSTQADTGLLCRTDAPADSAVNTPPGTCSPSGHFSCTTFTYNGYGEKTSMTTPLVNAGGASGSYFYLYYPDTSYDLSGHTSAGGWLQAVIDPQASFAISGQASTATSHFVAYGYDAAGNVVRTWNRNATTSNAQQAGCYPTFNAAGCSPPTVDYSQTLFGAETPSSCVADVAAMPWRYLRISVDAMGTAGAQGDTTCYQLDANGNQIAITTPRGVANPGLHTTTTQTFNADDELTSRSLPAGASDPSLGSVAATTTWTYDGVGNKTSQTSPVHTSGSTDTPVTAWVYDAANRATGTYTVRNATSADGTGCGQNPPGQPSAIPAGDYVCVTHTSLDGLGDTITSTDATGAVTTNSYDSLGRKTQTVAPGATVTNPKTQTVYDADGNTVAVCGPRAFAEGNPNLTCAALAGGPGDYYSTYRAYDPADHLSSVTTYRVAADTADGSVPACTTSGQTGCYSTLTSTSTYDADGNAITSTDPAHVTTTTTFDSLDRKTAVGVPRSSTVTETSHFYYDPSGDLVDQQTPAGRDTRNVYDNDLRLTISIAGYDGAVGANNPTNYNPYNPVTGADVRTQRFYDADGNTVAVLTPDAFTTSVTNPNTDYLQAWDFDTVSRPTAAYEARYDSNQPDPSFDNTQKTDCTTSNRPAAVTAAPSVAIPTYGSSAGVCVTRAYYDADNDKTRVVEASAAESANRYSEYTFSDDGHQLTANAPSPVTNGTRVTYTATYDADGRPLTQTTPNGLTASTVYNPDGSTSQTRQNANPGSASYLPSGTWFTTASYIYDAAGDKIAVVAPNITGVTAPTDACSPYTNSGANNQVSCTSYNSDGTKASVTDTGGDLTSYTYNPDGDPVSVTSPDANAKTAANPNGLATINGYSQDNLLTFTASAINTTGTLYKQTNYTYDADANQTGTDTVTASGSPNTPDPVTGYPTVPGQDPGAITTTYDATGRKASQTGRGGTDTITNTYDAAGHLTRSVDNSTTVSHSYTTTDTASYYLDGLLAASADGTRNLAYTYDGAGAPLARQDGAVLTSYTNNDAELATAVTDPAISAAATTLGYDPDGRNTTQNTPNGDTLTVGYNTDNTVAAQNLTNPVGTLADWTYGYDNQSRVTSQNLLCNTSCPATGTTTGTWDTRSYTYSYDAAGRINGFNQGGTNQAVTYDPDGNRTQYGTNYYLYQPDDAICATSSGTSPTVCSPAYTYNPDGLLTSDGCTARNYDGFDRTAQAIVTATSCGSIGTVTYNYDGLERQTSHTSTIAIPSTPVLPANVPETVSYDGLGAAIADETINTAVPTTISYQLAANGTAQAVTDGIPTDTQYLTGDGANNIATTETAAGTLGCATRYDPFGNPIQAATATSTCATGTTISDLGYQQGRRDQTTGDYQDGTRTYDPTKAAFTGPDNYTSGNTNQNPSIITDPLTADTYTYVNGNPLNFNDPDGHHPVYDYGCWTLACEDKHDAVLAGRQDAAYANLISGVVNSLPQNAGGVRPDSATVVEQTATAINGYYSCISSALEMTPDLGMSGAERHCISLPYTGYSSVYNYLHSGGASSALLNTQILGASLCAQHVGECTKTTTADLINFAVQAVPLLIPGVGEGADAAGGSAAADAVDNALGLTADAVDASVESAASNVARQLITCGGESFTPDTQVRLADGGTVRLDQIRIGDMVLATDPQTGNTKAEPVTALWVNHDNDLLDLAVRTSGGAATIHTTQHHLFYDLTTRSWVEAEKLTTGDRLYTADGEVATVNGRLIVAGSADMWDLTVANDHDFYIDTFNTEVLVHNCPIPGANSEAGFTFAVDSSGETSVSLTTQSGDTYDFDPHALQRLTERGVSLDQARGLLESGNSFQYFHDGVWKTGFYDPASKLFVGTANGTVITVIRGASQNYINNLMAAQP